MNRAQSDTEFVETAFTTEEAMEVVSTEIFGDDATTCAFLEKDQPPSERRGSRQPS